MRICRVAGRGRARSDTTQKHPPVLRTTPFEGGFFLRFAQECKRTKRHAKRAENPPSKGVVRSTGGCFSLRLHLPPPVIQKFLQQIFEAGFRCPSRVGPEFFRTAIGHGHIAGAHPRRILTHFNGAFRHG